MVFERLRSKEFDLRFSYHSDAILLQDFPEAATELDEILSSISIPIIEIVRGGGGEALVTQRLRRALSAGGWPKTNFYVEKRINDRTTFSESHEVDHIKEFSKGIVALEIEWNNKDPFFDRDLENFNRLHSDGAISIGMIVTRGRSLQAGIENKILAFATANSIDSFSDLERIGVERTPRQRRSIERLIERTNCTFAEAWVSLFTRDKFGSATTHWVKLEHRINRGVGSPCPLVAIGIPISCIVGGN